MTRPTFVLIHGAWHGPSCFSKLSAALISAGYNVHTPTLPSLGGHPTIKDMDPDINTIRDLVDDLVKSEDVAVVMHSYGGLPGSQALEGLDKHSCKAKGLSGGVIKLIYIMAYMVPEGYIMPTPVTSSAMSEILIRDPDAGTITVNPAYAKQLFYQDIPDPEVAELVKELQPHSIGVFAGTTKFAAWRYISTYYFLCENDNPITVKGMNVLVHSSKENRPNRFQKIIYMKAGHFPFISKPDYVAGLLRLIVEE